MPNRKSRRTLPSRFKRQSDLPRLPDLCPLAPKQDALGLFLLFVGTFLLFALSTSRTVMLEDDGLFITAAYTLGLVHPPGYPLYTLLGWIFSHIPVSSVAWRVHALSGAFGALTCVCIAYLVIRRTGYRPAAYLAGAILAVSDHFWSQSLIADVYTTNTALLFLTLVLGQEAVVRKNHHLWIAAAVCYGLGLANHWILLILGSPVLLAWAWIGRRELLRRLHFLIPIVLIVPALLYGWMMYRSQQNPEINFLGPINTLSELAAYIRRDMFAAIEQQVTAGILDKFQYIGYVLGQLFIQLTPLGFLIALAGMIYSYRQGWRLGLYAELAALVAGSLLLIAFLGFEYNEFQVGIFRPYVITLYGILALRFGYGLYALKQWADHRFTHLGLMSTSSALIIGLFWWNAQVNWRSGETFARDYAKALLDSLEPNAILVTKGDANALPTAYLHIVEGYRPDIMLLEHHGLLFKEKVIPSLVTGRVRNAAWVRFFLNNERPFYHQNLSSLLKKYSGQHQLALVQRADRSISIGQVKIIQDDAIKTFFIELIRRPPSRDIWTNRVINTFIASFGKYIGYILASQSAFLMSSIADALPLAEENYWSLVGMSSTLVDQPLKHSLDLGEKYLNKAKQITPASRSKPHQAHIFYLEGQLAFQRGQLERARALLLESIEINPDSKNSAYRLLDRLSK